MENFPITPLREYISFTPPLIVAGPCSAENEDQLRSTGRLLAKDKRVDIFRAGLWKARTQPENFCGSQAKGLVWLQKIREETGLMTAVEVSSSHHVHTALSHNVDILWIGARSTANPLVVQDIADALKGVDIPVMVKNPINPDLSLWIGAIKRLAGAGISKLMAVHRGFCLYPSSSLYRNPPLWTLVLKLKEIFRDLPVLCDPSHMGGSRQQIFPLCEQAMTKNMDGLMVEVHHKPEKALSDKDQQITPDDFCQILDALPLCAEKKDIFLSDIREEIDIIDQNIVNALQERMNLVKQIAKAKHKKNMDSLQLGRLEELIVKWQRQGKKASLSSSYINDLITVIHNESLRQQVSSLNS